MMEPSLRVFASLGHQKMEVGVTCEAFDYVK